MEWRGRRPSQWSRPHHQIRITGVTGTQVACIMGAAISELPLPRTVSAFVKHQELPLHGWLVISTSPIQGFRRNKFEVPHPRRPNQGSPLLTRVSCPRSGLDGSPWMRDRGGARPPRELVRTAPHGATMYGIDHGPDAATAAIGL